MVGAVQQDVHVQLYVSAESADRTALVQGGTVPPMKQLQSLELVHHHPGGSVIRTDPEEGIHPVWQWMKPHEVLRTRPKMIGPGLLHLGDAAVDSVVGSCTRHCLDYMKIRREDLATQGPGGVGREGRGFGHGRRLAGSHPNHRRPVEARGGLKSGKDLGKGCGSMLRARCTCKPKLCKVWHAAQEPEVQEGMQCPRSRDTGSPESTSIRNDADDEGR